MTRVQTWERRAEWPLLFLALAFLVAWAVPILDPHAPRDAQTICTDISWTVWAAFAVDFLIRLALADGRLAYARRHWYDVALIALPLLRPLRLLRVLAFARVLHRAASNVIARVAVYVGGAAVMSVVVGAIAVLGAEQKAPDANITSFGDALWWAATTCATVGYGDRYPVTTQGRFLAVGLMVIGVAFVGTVTATVSAWLVKQVEAGK